MLNVSYLDLGVWVPDGAAVVCCNVGDAALAKLHSLHLAQLVCSLIFADAVHNKATLGVIHQTEVLICLVDVNHIHEACWVCHICADLAINLDKPLHQDGLHLLSCQGIPGIHTHHHP